MSKNFKEALMFVVAICTIVLGAATVLEIIKHSFFKTNTTITSIVIVFSVMVSAVIITCIRIHGIRKENCNCKK